MIDAQSVLTPEGFAEAEEAWLKSKVNVWPSRAHYLFNAAHPCDRHLVWNWNLWEAKKGHGPTLESIFGEGRIHQEDTYRRLEAMGFKIVREQDRSKQWRVGKNKDVIISGRVDGRVIGYRDRKYDPSWLLEIKSASPYQFDRLNIWQDLLNSEHHYVRNHYLQGQLGMLLENIDHCVEVLKNKLTGRLKIIPFELDFAYVEDAVKRIERLDGMVKRREDPPPIGYDERICGDCGFNFMCWPPRDLGEGAALIEDAAFVEDLVVREALLAELGGKPKQLEELDKDIKLRAKKYVAPGGTGIAGPFVVEVSERHVKAEAKPRPERTDTLVKIKRLSE
jgi:CRISPR/Cas system-associated exonuclease Cas4 (RecB family)